jgi:predicted deacylase
MDQLVQKGYHVAKQGTRVMDDYTVDTFYVNRKKQPSKRIVLSVGLHGIEGYVGHASLMTFIDEILPHLSDDCEVVIIHPINPFGMDQYRRNNEHNVDLNRNFFEPGTLQKNRGYEQALSFFKPQLYKSKFHANRLFYQHVMRLITTYGKETMREATLRGQSILPTGISYSGTSHEPSTAFILKQIPILLKDSLSVVWIDIHSGYGPRYQMSIVNSKHEKEQTKAIRNAITYPRILGLYEDDFYEVDGDMIEAIYRTHKQTNQTCKLYATCFEFGTLGDSFLKQLDSLRAMIFENASYHLDQDGAFDSFATQLMKELFMPPADDWRHKAYTDFIQATTQLLSYFKLIKE